MNSDYRTNKIIVLICLLFTIFGCQSKLEKSEHHIEEGLAAQQEGNYESALLSFQLARNLMPDSTRIALIIADLHYEKEDFSQAITELKQAIDLDPETTEAFYKLGLCQKALGEVTAATLAFEQVTELEADNWRSLSELAGIHISRFKFDKAIEYAKAAVAINSNDIESYKNLTTAYWVKQEHEKAINACINWVGLAPEQAQAHSRLGEYYYFQGNYEKACGSLAQSLNIDPGDAHSLLLMGYAQLKRKEYQQSRNFFERSIAQKADNLQAYTGLGELYTETESYYDLIRVLKEALTLEEAPLYRTMEPVVRVQLGLAYVFTSQEELARQQYRQLKQSNPSITDQKSLAALEGGISLLAAKREKKKQQEDLRNSLLLLRALSGSTGNTGQGRGVLVKSRINGTFEGWSGSTIFPLENGQVWQQSPLDFDFYYHYAYRPAVTIFADREMKVGRTNRTVKVVRIK